MARTPVALHVPDISSFSKNLRRILSERPMAAPLKQTEMLHNLARAAGFENYQHLKSAKPDPNIHQRVVQKALRCFDDQGRLTLWPAKTSMQALCMWPIWAALDRNTVQSERDISLAIDNLTTLNDAAQIRRTMVECRLVRRNRDGSAYQRIEQRPPIEARELIGLVSGLRKVTSR